MVQMASINLDSDNQTFNSGALLCVFECKQMNDLRDFGWSANKLLKNCRDHPRHRSREATNAWRHKRHNCCHLAKWRQDLSSRTGLLGMKIKAMFLQRSLI